MLGTILIVLLVLALCGGWGYGWRSRPAGSTGYGWATFPGVGTIVVLLVVYYLLVHPSAL